MLFWKRKKKVEQPKERPFYCREFRNLAIGQIFGCVGRTCMKQNTEPFNPNAIDINTGEKVRINPAWLCVVYLEEE